MKEKVKELLDKGVKISKDFRFGKTSESSRPKRECPECKNTVMIKCIGIKEYKCPECGHTWREE